MASDLAKLFGRRLSRWFLFAWLAAPVAAILGGALGVADDSAQEPGLVRTLSGHWHGVWYVAFSPDGKTLASAGEDQSPPQPPKRVRAAPTADHPTNPAVGARLKLVGPPEKVVELDLSNADLSDADLVCLTKLPNLETLNITLNRDVTCEGMAYLAAVPKLRNLQIGGNEMCADRILAAKSIERLRFGVGFGDAAFLQALAAMPNLRELDLGVQNDEDELMAALENLTGLRVLRLYAPGVSDAGLAHLKGLRNLDELDFPGHPIPKLTGPGLQYLAGLPKLRRLSAGFSGITDDGLAHVAGLRQLESLDLGFCRIGDAGLEHLQGLTNLRELNLQATQVGDAGLAVLKGMHHLRKLNLGRTKITSDGMETIGQLASLEELDLGRTKITEATRERKASPPSDSPFDSPAPPGPATVQLGSRPALEHLKNLVRLRKLGLAGIGGDGLDQLVGLPSLSELDMSEGLGVAGKKQLEALPHLEILKLCGCRLGLTTELDDLRNLGKLRELDMSMVWYSTASFRPGAQFTRLRKLQLTAGAFTYAVALGSLAQVPELRELELASPLLDDAGILQQTGLGQVESLILDAPRVTDDGLKFLDGWKNLKELTLRCELTDAGLPHVAQLGGLRKLTISNTWITDAGLNRLAALTNLRRLDITYTACTTEGVDRLQRALPDCEILSGGRAPHPPWHIVLPPGTIQ